MHVSLGPILLLSSLAVAQPAFAEPTSLAIRIQGACSAGRFQLPSWCPDPGPAVLGGLERLIELKVGAEVELLLENRYPWHTRGDLAGYSPDAWFVLATQDRFDRCHRVFATPQDRAECSAHPAFGLSILVPAGTDYRARFVADRPGLYRYYDDFHFSGYGVLRVVP